MEIEKGDSRDNYTSTTNVQNSNDALVDFVVDDFYNAEDTYDNSATDGLALEGNEISRSNANHNNNGNNMTLDVKR